MARSGVRAGGGRTERFSNASQYWAVWASVSTLKKRRGPSLVSTSTVMSFGSGIMALSPACQLEFTAVPQDEWYLTKKSVGFQLVPCDRHGDEKETPKPKANEM